MSLFVGKDELALRGDFDFRTLFDANVCYLLDSYATSFFDVQFDPGTRQYNSRDCPMRMQANDSAVELSPPMRAAVADPHGDGALLNAPSDNHIAPLEWPRELWNRYMQEFKHLKPLADEIATFVREYFETDSLKHL